MHGTRGVTDGVYFNHNGDYSGEVWVTVDDDSGVEVEREEAAHGQPGSITIKLPFEDLQALVAGKIRMERITALEEATDEEILG